MKKLQDPWFHAKEQGTHAVQEARHSPKQREEPFNHRQHRSIAHSLTAFCPLHQSQPHRLEQTDNEHVQLTETISISSMYKQLYYFCCTAFVMYSPMKDMYFLHTYFLVPSFDFHKNTSQDFCPYL